MTIETKFNKYDSVYYLQGNKVKCNPINAISVLHEYDSGSNYRTIIRYRVEGSVSEPSKDHTWIEENKVFISKDELLKSL